MGTVMPANVNRVKLYRDDVPLFEAAVALSRREIDGPALASALARHPWMTATLAGCAWATCSACSRPW